MHNHSNDSFGGDHGGSAVDNCDDTLTASEAALVAPKSLGRSNSFRSSTARLLVGSAAVAVAVTIPDLSAGAMNSPYMRIDVSEPNNVLDNIVWSPAARASAPVYAPIMAAEEIAPSSLTFSSQSRFADIDALMPLNFLETGSAQFDLAFAGVEMPSPIAFAVAPRLPEQPQGAFRGAAPTIRTRVIEIPQITNVRQLSGSMENTAEGRAESRSERAILAPSGPDAALIRSIAAADESVAAAFAGTLDVSDGARSALPISEARQTQDRAQVVALAVPEQTSGTNSAAVEALAPKTQLDARINGVVTGSVDFQQQSGTIAIRLGSVVDLLRDRYSASELDRLMGASALNSYITLAQLQSAGVPISYDAVYDEIELGIDYQDAPDAAKVQVEQIGAPTMGTDRTMMEQIPR